MPIQRRLPTRGFNNIHRVEYKVFNLGQIDQLAEKYGISEFSPENLYINGLISQNDLVKILGNGDISTKLAVTAHKISAAARTKIEQAGGTVTLHE